MKILLTGANGQLGHYIKLVSPEYLDSTSSLITFGRGALDLRDKASIRRAVLDSQPDVVINAGAYTAVDRAESEPDLARRVNGDAVADLVDSCHEVGARLIQISTDYVFDGIKHEPYLTTDKPNPINTYGATKLLGEQIMANRPGAGCIVRTSWIYSEYGNNFANTMRRLFKERQMIKVVNDQIGRPTHAADLANFCLKLAMNKGVWAPTIHYAGSEIMSWHTFACRLLDESNDDVCTKHIEPILTCEYPTSARRPLRTVLKICPQS
jgi:dTDP-4-dehydrorhamnose reductase